MERNVMEWNVMQCNVMYLYIYILLRDPADVPGWLLRVIWRAVRFRWLAMRSTQIGPEVRGS